MKYAISIVVHNNLELTQKCIASVIAHSMEQDYKLIVTDNASTDGTLGYLSSILNGNPELGFVFGNAKNLGFGEPHNEALKFIMGHPEPPEYFVVLNNDIEVCGHWLRDMSAALESDPKMAICGIKGTCCGIGKDGVGHPSGTPEYVEASCLMIRADLAWKHGLFSPEFAFAYYEDSDLSLRMRQLGYKIVHVPLSVRHHGAATSKIVADVDLKGFWLRNQKVFLEKWKDYMARRSFGARSIMIRRSEALGDVLLTTPVVRALKAKYPNAEISMITNFPEVYRGNASVVYAGKKMLKQIDKYDYFFDLDLAYEKNPQKHIVDAYAEVCGVLDYVLAPGGRIPWLEVKPEERAWAKSVLGDGAWVAIHPGPTAWPGRNWTPEGFTRVAGHILQKGGKVLLVGGPGAMGVQNTMDLRGKTTFHQLAAVLAQCGLFVGIDSAPMHIATAVETLTIGLFGCISPEYRLSSTLSQAVTAPHEEVGCLGCHHYLPAPRTSSECFREKARVPRCMERLRAEDVIVEVDKVLGWTRG